MKDEHFKRALAMAEGAVTESFNTDREGRCYSEGSCGCCSENLYADAPATKEQRQAIANVAIEAWRAWADV